MLKNIVDLGRQQMTLWRMCIVCWVPKATNTLSDYVIRITLQWKSNKYTFCFSTAAMGARTRLSVRLYVHCLSCFFAPFCLPLSDFIL